MNYISWLLWEKHDDCDRMDDVGVEILVDVERGVKILVDAVESESLDVLGVEIGWELEWWNVTIGSQSTKSVIIVQEGKFEGLRIDINEKGIFERR